VVALSAFIGVCPLRTASRVNWLAATGSRVSAQPGKEGESKKTKSNSVVAWSRISCICCPISVSVGEEEPEPSTKELFGYVRENSAASLTPSCGLDSAMLPGM
jgi:hypothetical protein